jgi:hypothetical protein
MRTTPAPAREEAFRELVALLVTHETAESLILYPTMSRFLLDDDSATCARLTEHRDQEALLSQLQRLPVSPQVFGGVLDELCSIHAVHVRKEEQLCVPLMKAMGSTMLLRHLGEYYDVIRRTAPRLRSVDGVGTLDPSTTPLPRLSYESHRHAHLALSYHTWTASIGEASRGAA